VNSVAALFVRRDSIYKRLPDVDAYDIDRDARSFPGGMPVVAHPPCRAWGGLRQFAKPRPDEKSLALFAVGQVRREGGVLEHPRASTLWRECDLPLGLETDAFGGFSISVDQSWWGYPARKATLLYVCGCARADLPPMPISLHLPPKLVDSSARQKGRMNGHYLPKSQREVTVEPLAMWLVELALRCSACKAEAAE